MLFEEYCKIMKEHGIGDFCFLYNDMTCCIRMEMLDFSLYYNVYIGNEFYSSDNFEEIISLKYTSLGKNLKEIWDEIEIISVDGFSESDYDFQTCSYNYVKWLKEIGDVQWSHFHSVKTSFFMQLRYVFLGAIILPILSVLYPVFNLANWNIVLLVGLFATVAFICGVIILLRNRLTINYHITTKKIFIFNGLDVQTSYDNIKKVKLKKSIFNKNQGTVKLYLKKGISLNYQLQNIPDFESVYKLIVANINKNSENAK